MMMARVLVSVLMTALLHCCHVDSFFMAQKADISPTDALVFINETLRVQCQLRPSTNISPSDMYFELQPRANDTWKIPQQETIIGNRSITTDLEITSRYSNYTTLYCKDRNENILRSAGIFVEYPIMNITNLTGTLFYDNSSIIFTWGLGQAYLDPSSIIVQVDWNPYTEPNLSGNSCNLSSAEFCLILWHDQSTIFIRINISHAKGASGSRGQVFGNHYETSATSVHEFRPYDNLKTGPPQALKVENVTNTCVEISWEDSLYFRSNKYINTTYRIEMKADDEPEFSVTVDQAVRLNSSEAVRICDLIPFTKYSLSVQLKAKDINPWSDRAILVFETEEDRPLTGPPMTDTSYHLGECTDNKRDVLVYWNDPSKQSLQGQLVRFEVESNNSSKKFLRAAYNYYTDSIDCDSASQIRVYSATKVGPSVEASEMYIPKESDELTFRKDLMFMVEEKSGFSSGRSTINATVKWNAWDHVGNVKLIVYMCAETYIPNTCFNDFETIEVNLSEKELQLIDMPSTTNLFGYASKDDNDKKSGIRWTNCVYQIDNKPDKPAGLHVVPGINSLEISWTPAWCNKDKKVLIIHYYLLICKQPREMCVDSTCCQNITVSDFNISNHTAKDLVGGRPYFVYIQAESPAGLGYLSDVKVATPHTSDGSYVDRIVGITLGTSSAVFIGALLVFRCFRCCCKSRKKTKQLNEKSQEKTVTLPDSVSRQDSGDSGAWTGSDPSTSIESRPIPPSRPADLHSFYLSTLTESNTVSSVVEISPVDNAGAASHANVSPCVADDFVRSAPYMKIGNASLSHNSSHTAVVDPELLSCSSASIAESSAPYMQLGDASLKHYSSHTAVVDPALMCTSSASNTEGRLARGSCVSAASGSAGAQEDAQSSLDADTSNSNQYMLFKNTDLSYDSTQPAPDVLQEDVSNESSSDSCPVLQLEQTSHLPQDMQQDIPMLIFHTHQVHEQTAPIGEDNCQPGDYVMCGADGNICYQTENCRPDTNSVVPQDVLECQALAEGGNQGRNSASSDVEESETRSNRIDLVVPLEVLLSSEHQLHHSSLGQNAAGPSVPEDSLNNISNGWNAPEQNVQLSNFKAESAGSKQAQNVASSNLQENHLKVDGHAAENDPNYVTQVDANIQDIRGDGDQCGVRPTHTCLEENTYFDDNTSLLSSRSDLSFNSSNYDFNIDSLISNRFMNDGDSNFNMQGEDNFHNTEVLDGLNHEFRNDPRYQDSVNARGAPENSSSDHQGASFQASQTDLCDDESWNCDHSGETSGDAELDDSRQQRVSFVDSSGYQPLAFLDTYSSCEGSDLSQNSPTC